MMVKTRDDTPRNGFAPLPGEANPDTEEQVVQILGPKAELRAPLPVLRPPFNSEKIPQALKANARWAPWKAVFNEKRNKFDKIPHQAVAPFYGLSTAKPERWYTYEAALKAFLDNPELFAGVGYVMTKPHGVVGIDLDDCVHDNTIDDWAQQVIDSLASYTELSPSGTGLRILVTGEIGSDWTNHEVGIEVYGGHEPRFLTVTGQRLKVSVPEVAAPAPDALAGLEQAYAKVKITATVISLQLPEIIDEALLPNVATLGLHFKASDFLTEGKVDGDRSRALFASAAALYSAGLSEEQVFGILATNPFAMEVALDHRRQDHDRALMYLWVEHCQKAKARGTSKVASADDFEDISEQKAKGTSANVEPLAILNVAKPMRFTFLTQAELLARGPMQWLVKKVLPFAEVGVVFGESTAGKTFFTLDMVMAIARGVPWNGRKVTQGTVAYICAEGSKGFSSRLRAYHDHHGTDHKKVPLVVLPEAPNFMEKADIKDLVVSLRTIEGLNTVVVDTLAQVTPGANENTSESMGRALAHCKVIHEATGAMVLLVAHSGKDASKGVRGWSGIKGALDVEILVERSGNSNCATVTKTKDSDGEGDQYPFKLDSVLLGQEEDGEDITSCVVKPAEARSKSERKTEPKGRVQQVVLQTAIALTDLPGAVSTSHLIDAAVSEIPKDDLAKRDRRRQRVMEALESLVAANRLSITSGTVNVL